MKKHKKMACLLAAGCLAAALMACTGNSSLPQSTTSASSPLPSSAPSPSQAPGNGSIAGQAEFTLENYPRVDGSTANLPLMARVMSEACGIPLEDAENRVSASKTTASWQALLDGRAELILSYAAPAEMAASEEMNQLEITPIGRDGLVFLVHKDNPVESLTVEQLRNIYAGEITNWQELGGKDEPIAAFQRNAESGSQTLFLKLVMQGTPLMEAPAEMVPGEMGGLIDAVASFDGGSGAIGYSVYYYASEMYENPALKLLAVEGVQPENATLANGSYPLLNEFYAAIRADKAADSPARRLYEWVLGEKGRVALEAAGYVPIRH